MIQSEAFTAEALRTQRERDLGVDGVTTNARPMTSGDRAYFAQTLRRPSRRSYSLIL